MMQVVDTGLPEFGRPTEHATMGDGHLRTTAIPLKADGTFETGEAHLQIELALSNLEKTVKAAGGRLTDVLQVIVFLTNHDHFAILDKIWVKYFSPPYPNRGVIIVNGFGTRDITVLMQVHAYIKP